MSALRWARDEIAALDPVADARRITELSFEVRVGSPLLIHAMFSLAFARQVAVPEIAEVLYRDGRGLIMRNPRKRNNDTLVRFGQLIGGDESAIARIQQAHSPYPITNDLNLYTLATLACEPRRIAGDYFSDTEIRAHYEFWAQVGRALGIEGIPPDPEAFMAFYTDFEARRYAPTPAGRAVTRSLADEFASRWFPARSAPVARDLFFSLFDERLQGIHGVHPSAAGRLLVRGGLASYLLARRLRPDGPHRSITDSFR
jgi:hypothetical protein